MTDKIDFKKTLDAYRAPRGRFRIIEVPDMQYLMIGGRGDPNTSPAFAEAVGALYPVAHKLSTSSWLLSRTKSMWATTVTPWPSRTVPGTWHVGSTPTG